MTVFLQFITSTIDQSDFQMTLYKSDIKTVDEPDVRLVVLRHRSVWRLDMAILHECSQAVRKSIGVSDTFVRRMYRMLHIVLDVRHYCLGA